MPPNKGVSIHVFRMQRAIIVFVPRRRPRDVPAFAQSLTGRSLSRVLRIFISKRGTTNTCTLSLRSIFGRAQQVVVCADRGDGGGAGMPIRCCPGRHMTRDRRLILARCAHRLAMQQCSDATRPKRLNNNGVARFDRGFNGEVCAMLSSIETTYTSIGLLVWYTSSVPPDRIVAAHTEQRVWAQLSSCCIYTAPRQRRGRTRKSQWKDRQAFAPRASLATSDPLYLPAE
ncbi:hypothetical protein BC628DRAFT_86844 [Trametes gibbosa]|nr:hypothetical protein BC628DRAFT_86844 [Trametes gibbosa]